MTKAITDATTDPIPLPTWTDATSVATFLTAGFAVVVGAVTYLDPSIAPQVTSAGHSLIPSIAEAIAGIVVTVNVIRHTVVHKAAITTQGNIKIAHAGGFPVVAAVQAAPVSPK